MSVKMASIEQIRDQYWRRCGEKKSLCTVSGNINSTASMENSIEVTKKIKNRITT